MSYAFDPELAPWVPMITDLPFSDLAAARAAEKAMTANLPMYEPDRPVDVRAAVVPGPEGASQVPVRIYTPVGAEAAGSGLPGLVYLHGGGYVLGSPDFATPTCCGSPTRSARWWSRWTTGWHPSIPSRADWRTPTPHWSGRPGTRRSWTSTRPGWPSAATARAVGSPRPYEEPGVARSRRWPARPRPGGATCEPRAAPSTSRSADWRAAELEGRVVLTQHQTAVNNSGSLPSGVGIPAWPVERHQVFAILEAPRRHRHQPAESGASRAGARRGAGRAHCRWCEGPGRRSATRCPRCRRTPRLDRLD